LVVEKDKTDLKKILEAASAALDSGKSSDGVYVGNGAPAKVAVLFSGQGSQYVGMGRDVICQFPAAQRTLQDADAAFDGDKKLSRLIFPHPSSAAPAKEAQEKELRSTDVAQPALGAVGLGLFRVLEDFGLKASALAGHSYGELAALCAAG